MNETKSMDGNVFHRLDPKSGLIDPTALQNMSELKMMIENLRQPSHAEHEGSLETPYISYEEVYPPKKAIDLSLIKQSEKKFWQELVDSNIRAGTIACLWCLKAQAVKRLSLAFNKWKVFAAVKTHELILRESQEFQQPDVVTVIDNALAIIRRYKEGGIMNQINQSRDLNGIDVAFPWEERRQQQSGLTAAGILGVNDQAYPYTFDAPARNLDSHQSSLRDTMESTEKEWSFVKSQFRPANVQDIESERQSLLALSYDIIRRGKSNDGNHQSYPPSNPSSPRDSMPPISTDVSKRSSLNLLNPDPVSPRDSGKRFSPHSTSPANRLRNLSPTAVHPPGVSPKASSSTHSIQQPSTILRTGSDEFNYHVNEPAGLFPMKNTPAQTQAYRQKSEARAPSNSRFPENTLQIPSDYHDVNHQHHYSPHFEQRIENRTYPETAQTRQTYPRRSETTERGRTVTPARPLNGSSSASTSAAKVKRPSASSSPTKKPYSEKTLVDMIKFRSSKEGSYVKELLTPREEKSTFDAKQNSVFDESQNLAMFSETANISNTSSMMPRSGRKQGRSISPTDKPRYLLPTNSYRKKVVSGGEAPIMKQRLEREKYPRETQHRAPNNDSLHNREHHSTRQHYTEPHHNHQEFPSTRLSASYQSVSHDGFPLYNSQYTMPHPHTHHSAPQHNTHDHHHHPSSAAPRDNFHSSSNHPTDGKDAEYEYYEQLLKEQQQQFLNYQAQTAIRPQNGQVPVPEFSSISTSAMAGPSNSHDQAEFLSFNHYTAQMKDTANDVSNFNHQPAEQTETHNNLFNQEYHQTSYETSPDQNIPHSEPYDNNYDSMYSLNPNYYNQRGFQSNIQSFATTEPHNNNNSSHSKRGSAKRSPTNKKMDKAQRMLLYGVLHDVLDAKRAWEKNLRK